jgi:hypothetical protein
VPFQYCEIDCRPRQPRQLAGANGNSAPCEASVDTSEFAGKRMLDGETGPLNSSIAGGDAAEADGAAVDIAFKPNCLGMQTSIDGHPVRRRASSQEKP